MSAMSADRLVLDLCGHHDHAAQRYVYYAGAVHRMQSSGPQICLKIALSGAKECYKHCESSNAEPADPDAPDASRKLLCRCWAAELYIS